MAAERGETLWLHAEARITLVELSEASGLPQAVLRELVEFGALCPAESEGLFAADCLARMRAARRLRDDLELETPALALALRFLERIEALENEVRALRALSQRPG